MKSQVRDSLGSYIYDRTKDNSYNPAYILGGLIMNVYDQAHGLAQAIKASEEYKQYDQAKKKDQG